MRECFFKHALARKTSKKLKKYLAKTFFFVYNKFIHGWIPEWPKGTDCKSAGDAFEGSNPSPPIIKKDFFGSPFSYAENKIRGKKPKRFESFSAHY